MMKKLIASAHPFLFTLLSLLVFYMRFRWETLPGEIIRPLIVLLLLNMALYPLAYKLGGNWEWAGILVTVFVFGLYFEKSLFYIVGGTTLAILFTLVVAFKILKRSISISHISFSLTAISLVFVVGQSVVLLRAISVIPLSYYKAMNLRKESLVIPLSEPESGIKPDIYYVILDAYAGSDVLRDFYGYDNSEFIGYLESLGFIVPEKAYSNYPRTALSVSSTLDMQYWDTISPDMDDVIFWWPTKPVIDHSRVRASLEAIGYKSISIASDWGLTDNKTTDTYFKPYPIPLTEYEDYFVRSTPLKLLHAPLQNFMPVRTNDVHRRYILYGLDMLKQIPEMEGPKFVFLHIIIPHPPFVFDANGNPIETDKTFTFGSPGVSKGEYRRRYIEQIEFVNSQVHLVIDSILEKSETEPIIILQADHGLGLSVSFKSPETGCLRDRFSVLGAYYLPGIHPETFPQDFTPVNLFRVIFNEYFGTKLTLLDNRQYFTKDHNLFAGLQNVTQNIDESCVVPPK